VLKFPSQKFLFARNGLGSSVSTHGADVIFVEETDEIYYIIRLTTAINLPTGTFTITNLRNSMGETRNVPETTDLTGVVIKMFYWNANRQKIERLTYLITNGWTDGGIWNTAMNFYPNPTPWVRNLNLDD
jgi:hypothetical protein